VPNSPQAGDPTAGLNTYINTITGTSGHTCIFCHPANPGTGTNGRIDAANTQPAGQPMKHSQLRNQYQKTNANFAKGAVSVNGFGFNNDGTDMGIFQFLGGPEFAPIQSDPTAKANLSAYVLCFNTGTAPTVGYSRTLTAATVNTTAAQSDWSTLQSQAATNPANIDLIANGTIQGQIHGLLYQPATNNYQTDTTGLGPFTQAQLTAFIQNGDTLTLMGVPPGSGLRLGLDSNLDGEKNGDARRKAAANSRTH